MYNFIDETMIPRNEIPCSSRHSNRFGNINIHIPRFSSWFLKIDKRQHNDDRDDNNIDIEININTNNKILIYTTTDIFKTSKYAEE